MPRRKKSKVFLPWQIYLLFDYILTKIPVIDLFVFWKQWANKYKRKYGGRR